MLSTTANTTRHLKTVWRGKNVWDWKAIYVGHAQPRGSRNLFRNRYIWRFHLTPLCASRDGRRWTIGLCFGKRTVYLYSHH